MTLNCSKNSPTIAKEDLPMFEDDMILPDDFQEDLPQSEEVTEELDTQELETESVEDTKPTEEVSEPVTEQQKIKIKYNHEEQELSLDEAVPLVQKGMNYDKLQERLQQLETDPRLSFVEELAQQNNMSVPEYLEAVQQQREQQRINQLVEQGISEELAQEMLENRKFREQFENERKAKAEEERANADYNEFFDYFRQANGRDFNAQSDEIPQSVWDATQNGMPLKAAYVMHENQQLRNQLQTLKQNESNAKKAPVGSVTAHGGAKIESEDDFLAGFNSI
jgi:hypothetical protein